MIAALTLVAQIGAVLGLGGIILRILGLSTPLGGWQRLAWAWVLGFGAWGWLVFILAWQGWLAPWQVGLALAGPWTGLHFLRGGFSRFSSDRSDLALLLLAATLLLISAFEAVTPPSDADSLAYHFALVKHFATQGHLLFFPQAVDGAVPMLAHMTYLSAYVLGGQPAMTGWTTFSGWAAGGVLFALAVPHLGGRWAALLALGFLTMPAVVYGAGSGQVEVRLAAMTLAATLAAGRALVSGQRSWALVAGLCAGFSAAIKMTALLLPAATMVVFLPWLLQRWRLVVPYALAFVLAAWQWYWWQWHQSGDPLFPLLSPMLGHPRPDYWPVGFENWFRSWNEGEQPFPISLLGLVRYLSAMFLQPPAAIEAGRTGFGPLLWLILPFSILGAWRNRDRLRRSPLTASVMISLVAALLWFAFGPSQRVRHMLHLLPMLTLAALVLARRWRPGAKPELLAAILITLAVQCAGAAFFHSRYVLHLVNWESDADYLRNNIPYYPVIEWANAHLTPQDKLLTFWRGSNYYYEVPYFFAHVRHQAVLDMRPDGDSARFHQRVRTLGITHAVVFADLTAPPLTDEGPWVSWPRQLVKAGCAEVVATLTGKLVTSRALALTSPEQPFQIIHFSPGACAL